MNGFISVTIGFFHFVDENQEIVRLQTWSTNTLKNMCKAQGENQHYPISGAGIWTEAVTKKQPVTTRILRKA